VQAPPSGTIIREAPVLSRKATGGYRFTGNGFDATIDPDGTVRMRDRFVSSRIRLRARPINQTDWVLTFWETKFDLFGWLDRKMGNDPYRSERRWFLDGTRDLREQLATGAAVENVRVAMHAIWNRAGLDFAERKRRTFALWDESSEDDFGQVGRAQILKFVREQCPRDSALGFRDEELRTLNAGRRSRTLFAPYVEPVSSADASVAPASEARE
jgi:hypothetical protein